MLYVNTYLQMSTNYIPHVVQRAWYIFSKTSKPFLLPNPQEKSIIIFLFKKLHKITVAYDTDTAY